MSDCYYWRRVVVARQHWSDRAAVKRVRDALDHGISVLPTSTGMGIPADIAAVMTGRTAAQIRAALGDEVFTNRHVEKVTRRGPPHP
jgi:hypothetical protein